MKKRIVSLLLALILVFSMMPVSAQAEESAGSTITAYVSISQNGKFVSGKDGKSVAAIPVTLTGKESYTLDDALKAVHDACYEGGSAAGYESYNHETYGLSLKKLWGDSSGMFGYQVNRGTVTVSGMGHVISDGDYIDAYINQSAYPDNEAYAVFNKNTSKAAAGGKITLKLTQAGYDENGKMTFSACEGAAITINGVPATTTVDGVEKAVTTNSSGSATIIIDKVGTYVISATKNKEVGGKTVTAITAPVCIATVTEVPRLADLRVSKVWSDNGDNYELNPAFDPNITTYTISVPDYTSSVFPYATQAETNEGKGVCFYYSLRGFGMVGYTTGNNISLSSNQYFGVVIYDKSNSMTNEDIRYTVNISKFATLKSLVVDGIENVPFDRGTNEGARYYVDSTAEGVKLTPTAHNSGYTVIVNGTTVASGSEYVLPYNWDESGKMEVSIKVSGSGVTENTYTVVLEKQPLNDTPFIMTQPVEADYTVIDDSVAALKIDASANGTLAYQWYYNTTDSNENGILVEGATEASYTPPITEDVIGTRYYYCVITNTGKTENNIIASKTARITVDPDPTPKAVITNPGNKLEGYNWNTGYVYNVDETAAALTVKATSAAEGGTWSYQWCTLSQAYNGKSSFIYKDGSKSESFIPSTALSDANSNGKYYGCLVTYTFKDKSYSSLATTGVTHTEGEGEAAKTYDVTGAYVFIKVDKASTPSITKQPVSASYNEGDNTKNLSVGVTNEDGGDLSYQWYVNDTNSNEGGTAIEGATATTYNIGKVTEGGTKYYYCVITNTIQGYTSSVTSETAEIKVKTLAELIGEKLSGSGTEEDPYLIADTQDYQDVADLVTEGLTFQDMYLKQTGENITLPENWKGIGISGTRFAGTLDGNNKTVTVPEGGLPLFGYINGATVKNLNIYGTKIEGYGLVNNLVGVGLSGEAICIDNVTLKKGTQTLKAGLIGTYITSNMYAGCSATYYVTIKNCTIEEGVIIGYAKDQTMIGSFAGRVHGTIENCVSYATVYGKDYVGGIMGSQDNAMGGCVIKNSKFHGTVEASGQHAGGITGGGYSHSSGPNGSKVNITDCTVTGTITGSDKVGGIVGGDSYVVQLWGGHSLKNNSFTGTVKATEGTYIGGIIGYYGSLNKFDDITGNYYAANCGASKGIGFVQYVDTNCAAHETASGSTYINTAEGETGISGIPKTDHNRTDDPLGADAAKLCYTDTDTEPVATELKISGTYETEYITGDKLDLSGIVLTVIYNTGDSKTVNLSDVTVSGYDADKVGEQELTISYEGLNASITVIVKNPESDIKVTVSVLGDSKHDCETDGMIHTLADNNLETWLAAKEYTVSSNATVLDVLTGIFKANGISISNPTGNYIESLTRNGITLGQMDNHPNSGWMFTLNGVHGNLGVSEQYITDGDVIVFHYSDDYTKEKANMGEEDTVKIPEEVIALIDSIGTVTLSDETTIYKARKAYDALSDEQKALVTNYETLTEAEAELAKLKEELKEEMEEIGTIYKTTGDYLEALSKENAPIVGSEGGDWMVLGLVRSGRDVPAGYYDNVVAYVKENCNEKGQLHARKSTDNSRVILALTAAGYDVTDVAGFNLLEGLTDMNYVTYQGNNGEIWALLAFDSHDYEIPEAPAGAEQVTREKLVAEILASQLADGGWNHSVSATTADIDMTAMAIQALAPYYDTNTEVKAAVDEALGLLSSLQNDEGGFYSSGTINSEACAQVIVALTALGINPDTDGRFIKGGNSVVDVLCTYYVDGGGFKHTLDGALSGMATEQGYYALVSYIRMLAGKTSLYDMSDVEIGTNSTGGGTTVDSTRPSTGGDTTVDSTRPSTGDMTPIIPFAAIAMLSLITGAIILKKKKENF